MMDFEDVLVFFNRIGVRIVNDHAQPLTKNTEGRGMLQNNAFKVVSKDQFMYSRLMRDLNINGFSMLSDAQIRFRARDHKPLTGDLLVAVGRYVRFPDAQEAVKKMFLRKDHKVYDLQSLEFDNKLTEDPVCHIKMHYFTTTIVLILLQYKIDFDNNINRQSLSF